MALSSDFISGFCGETDADHLDTVSLLEAVRYDMAYMFAYRCVLVRLRPLPAYTSPEGRARLPRWSPAAPGHILPFSC